MSQPYQKLVERFKKVYRLEHLGAIAGWDQAVMMPAGGNQARSEALAELSSLTHELLTEPEVEEWLSTAKGEPEDAFHQQSIQEMERVWRNASVLPVDLVKAKSLAASECEHAWRQQRIDNNWQDFSGNLKKVVTLVKEEASIRAEASGQSPYDSLIDQFESGMSCSDLDILFGDLKKWLPDFIQQAVEMQKTDDLIPPHGQYEEAHQKALGIDVMKLLGFDFNHGRLDVSSHPFCGGVSEDIRMTTRYNTNDFVEALMGTIHETGHARYGQSLPVKYRGLPIGHWRSMGIHESQSLFFEMQLGRNPGFLKLIQPLIIKHLSDNKETELFSLNNLIKVYSRVKPGLIRVEADEITYPAHVVLRYEIEKALIEGDLPVDDIPQVWNEKMQQYLGLSTEDDYRNGCMQDIHWPMGMFGYFPSYTLGAMYAAQFMAAMKKTVNVNAAVSSGELSPIFNWLENNVWSQGCQLGTADLVKQATGETLNAHYLKQHLQQRYLNR